MKLIQYSKKRDLKKSGEPVGKTKKSSKNARLSEEAKKKSRFTGTGRENRKKPLRLFSYVIHKHHASHLHWDLRLEMKGVLKSWAIPKEPPKTKANKRLAIQVEDHPLAYAKFKGVIPEGNYGAGKVEIWDNGTYELIEKDKKKIEIKLHGKKLKGKYVLVKTKYGSKPEKSWLFMKI